MTPGGTKDISSQQGCSNNIHLTDKQHYCFQQRELQVDFTITPGIESSLDINSFNLRSEFGYFIVRGLALGLAIDYTYVKNFKTSVPDKTSETLIMPCLMYVIPLKSSLRPYAQIGAGVANIKQGEDYEEESFLGMVLAGVIGVKYFINETISMDFGVQLSSAKLTSNDDNLDLDTDNLAAGLGFSFYF